MKKKHPIQFIIWLMTYLLMYPILRVIFSVKTESEISFKDIKSPLLIVSNHKSMIDPWIIPIMIPLKIFLKVSPVRFTGATYFNSPLRQFLYKLGVIKLIYFLYNVIPLKNTVNLKEKLQPFKEALEEGSTVMFFPEGAMVKEDRIGEFKRGSAALAQMTNITILPVSIKYYPNKWRRECNISYGKTFKIPQELFEGDDNPSFIKSSEYLRNKVLDLYTKKDL